MSTRRHLVWDWNGTLLNDVPLVVAATNQAFASVGGPRITAAEHRREFRRPLTDYYSGVLGRPLSQAEFALINRVFHDTYQAGVAGCPLTADAEAALREAKQWCESQSLLSMWFHADLIPTVAAYGLSPHFRRVDGMRQPAEKAAEFKEELLLGHLAAQQLTGDAVVMVGDTVDDARAAAAVGARCVLYAGGFTDPEVLQATGAPVVDTLLAAVALARTL